MYIYFWIFSTFIIISLVGRIYIYVKGSDKNKLSIYDLVESLLGLVGVVGLYGYVYDIELGHKLLWKAVFFSLVAGWVYSLIKPVNVTAYKKLGWLKSIIIFGCMALLSFPAIYMLGLYAFYS